MHEHLDPYRKSGPEVSEIFRELENPVINPTTGDKIWTSQFVESNPFGKENTLYTLAISPEGEKVFGKFEDFLSKMESGKFEPVLTNLDHITGLRGIVKKIRINGIFGQTVYVKTLKPIAEPYLDISGIEQFTAMRLLQIEGVKVAHPLLATRYRIITKGVGGVSISNNDKSQKFIAYLKHLNEIRENLILKGSWNEELKIDEQPSNYLNTPNGIVAIDPIYRHSVMLFG